MQPTLIRELAAEAGFDLVRFGPADPGAHGERFAAWLDAGRAGEMSYLHRNRERITRPQSWLPRARSAITLAYDYLAYPKNCSIRVGCGPTPRHTTLRQVI
jgi:epoxyqueuosine reductase